MKVEEIKNHKLHGATQPLFIEVEAGGVQAVLHIGEILTDTVARRRNAWI